MSNETEEGVQEVKTAACDKLLQARVDARMAGKKVRHKSSQSGSIFVVVCKETQGDWYRCGSGDPGM